MEVSAHEQATLDQLESTPATARKTVLLGDSSDATPASAANGAASYTVVNLYTGNVPLGAMQCKTCRGSVRLVAGDCAHALTVKLAILCNNCGEIVAE